MVSQDVIERTASRLQDAAKDATTTTEYTVAYNGESHLQVLTQRIGSKWPDVLPFCLFNVAIMLALTWMQNHGYASIQMTGQGHTYIAVVVSFLLIMRVQTAIGRYNQARGHLATMCQNVRQLVQYACVFSADSSDLKSQEWRCEVAYRAMIMLKTAMACIDYPTTKVPAWDVPELEDPERSHVKEGLSRSSHSEAEQSMRVPLRISYLLQKTIHQFKTRLEHPFPGPPVYEMRCMGAVDAFLGGFYGIRLFMTTPVPFPLVQMGRTFLFVYVFTIPFALLGDASQTLAHCFVVFLLTYGFVGLELVVIDMDNPFGDDVNDFDNAALAVVAYEDVYLSIRDVDGDEWAMKLRAKMKHPMKSENGGPTEQSRLLGEP